MYYAHFADTRLNARGSSCSSGPGPAYIVSLWPQRLLLQSTAMCANVVFINIDWKASRMLGTLDANMKLLAGTIEGVVRNMNPTMICMCEVGETNYPLSEEQMQQLATRSMSAWRDAATEHIQLRSMFTTGSPYMTVYIDGPIRCSNHLILHNLYDADGEIRDLETL